MSEYIVEVPDEEAELFIARFGINGTTMFGYQLVDEIVRCRDCKYAMAYAKAAYCYYMNHVIGIDGFCAWSERRDA